MIELDKALSSLFIRTELLVCIIFETFTAYEASSELERTVDKSGIRDYKETSNKFSIFMNRKRILWNNKTISYSTNYS